MTVTVTVVNDYKAKIFGPKDHPGFPLLQVQPASMLQVEFDGPSSYYKAFQSIAPGASASFVQAPGGPAQVALKLTIEAPFQRTQSISGIAVNITADITITGLYYIPSWSVPQANYGLQIGSEPIINVGFAAQAN